MAIQSLKVADACPLGAKTDVVCGPCLRDRLASKLGVRNVSLHPTANGEATLELDYDPQTIPLSELQNEMKRDGVCRLVDRAEMVLGIDGMVSPKSEQAIESALSRLPGVVASASFASRSLRIEFDRTQCALPEIARRLDDLGFHLRSGPADALVRPRGRSLPKRISNWNLENRKLVMALVGGVLLLGALLVKWYLPKEYIWLRIGLIFPAYLLTGWFTFKDTIKTLWNVQFDIDVLMFAAAVGAASLGHFEEGGLLLFLFALGGAGEEMAMDRARRAIQSLAKLAPEAATIQLPDGRHRLVRVSALKVGDIVVVHPFDRVPADGTVSSGTSAIDQSPITGESVPVSKSPGAPVFAGTINGEGLLLTSVTKLASESTLAKIVKMVAEAQTTKSPTQVFTDKVERYYVPIVLIATAGLIVTPPLVFGGEWGMWFLRAMGFLTAASPCALAIGTPATVLSGIARAARSGVLVKGGRHLENLGRVTVIAFDKTGTLTRGKPELTDIISLNGQPELELLALAGAIESGSTHPLAQAIVGHARTQHRELPIAQDIGQIPGKGVTGRVHGATVAIGQIDLVAADDPATPILRQNAAELGAAGRTIVVMTIDGKAAAVLGLTDRLRDNAAETLRRLKRLGIKRTVMLTGDAAAVADPIAREVGIDEHYSDLLPQDKVRILNGCRQAYGMVAMVGDGVNDAPAMATVGVGVAMGGAGTDVAIETADVVLMADDLAKLPEAIGLSRFSRFIIKQNLIIALGVILVLAPMAALGVAQLGVAVLFHEGSTVVVVLNAMRLLVYKQKDRA